MCRLYTKKNVPSGLQCSVRQLSTGQMRTRHQCFVRCQMTTYKLQATWCPPWYICIVCHYQFIFHMYHSGFVSDSSNWHFVAERKKGERCAGSIKSFTKEHFILKKLHRDGCCLCVFLEIILLNPWSAKPRKKLLVDCRQGFERTGMVGTIRCKNSQVSACFLNIMPLFPLEQSPVYFFKQKTFRTPQQSLKLTLFIQLM